MDLNMKSALNLQPEIIKIQRNIMILILVFSALFTGVDGIQTINIVMLCILVVLFFGNYMLNKLHLYRHFSVYLFSKIIQMAFCFVAAFQVNATFLPVYLFFGICLFIELMITYPHEKIQHRQVFMITIILITELIVFISTDQYKFGMEGAFVFAVTGMFFYSFYFLYNYSRSELLGKLYVQTEMFREAAKTNDELRVSQQRFKEIHDEMAQRKYDLEVANKRLNKMTAEIYTQNELLRYISSVLDIRELIDVVTDAIIGTIGVDTCSLVIFDEMNEDYMASIKSNYPGNHLAQLHEDVNAGHFQNYFENDKIHLNNRVQRKNYSFIGDRPVGSIVIIPLIREELVYGLLVAEHATFDMFTENSIQFFRGIATQITIAIKNASMYALMEDMAVRDGLTGSYNRKYLQDHIPTIISNADKFNYPVTIAIYDIDKFKSVNDKYGHQFGDEAIRMIAVITEAIAGKYSGFAVRYGGEEFLLVLPKKTLEEGIQIMNELHQEIKETALHHETGEVFINISSGISSFPALANSAEGLLLRADNAMYYSKQNGRGRITVDHKDIEKVI